MPGPRVSLCLWSRRRRVQAPVAVVRPVTGVRLLLPRQKPWLPPKQPALVRTGNPVPAPSPVPAQTGKPARVRVSARTTRTAPALRSAGPAVRQTARRFVRGRARVRVRPNPRVRVSARGSAGARKPRRERLSSRTSGRGREMRQDSRGAVYGVPFLFDSTLVASAVSRHGVSDGVVSTGLEGNANQVDSGQNHQHTADFPENLRAA